MDVIKAEKEFAMRRFRRLGQIGQLLRFIEAAAALLLLSYSSTHIPAAARNSGQFLRSAAAFLISPHFVFLLGNAIVLVLLKSGQFSSQSAATGIGNICGEMSCSPPQAFGTAAEEQKTACGEKVERQREVAHDEGEVAGEDGVGVEEEGDDEEFRRMIEEFIAKQQRFRREESLAVATSDGVEDPVVL